MQKALYKRYANIKNVLAKLEVERKLLEVELLEDIKKNFAEVDGKYKAELEYGNFSLGKKTTSWSYTPAISKLEDKLKIAKYTEQQKGIATPVTKEVLTFTSNDEN